MNPNPAAQPDPKPDMFGGTNDPAMNEWLNTQQGLLDYPRHPRLDYFLTGPFKGKTPGQVREKLIGDYRSGSRQGYGQPAGGLQSPTMTGKNSLTPDAEWQEKFKPRGIATPQASPASPVQSAGMTMAKAGAVAPKPAAAPAAPAPFVSSHAVLKKPQPTAPSLATAAAAGPMSADGDNDALRDNDQDVV